MPASLMRLTARPGQRSQCVAAPLQLEQMKCSSRTSSCSRGGFPIPAGLQTLHQSPFGVRVPFPLDFPFPSLRSPLAYRVPCSGNDALVVCLLACLLRLYPVRFWGPCCRSGSSGQDLWPGPLACNVCVINVFHLEHCEDWLNKGKMVLNLWLKKCRRKHSLNRDIFIGSLATE